MAYIALYREWRPQMFDTLVGQQHVTKTLQNAILGDRIGHAYLFCGPRGTGKTSTAKIFAKALNCLNPTKGEPCNECENCNRVTTGSSMDVLEIDAASNRGIDEIRDLREKVKFSPTEGKFKVYIIDEVHMLTVEAFNALLKTLEEPPAHVIFILATTEPHKLPLTILSRCQRFDFRRITIENIITRLEEIVAHNKLSVEGNGLWVIAKNAEGGLRDALSLLDQCISFSEKGLITIEDINSILGIANTEIIVEMVNAISQRNSVKAILLLEKLVEQGKDLKQFLKDLIEFYRSLLMLKVTKNNSDLSNNYSQDTLDKVGQEYSKEQIINILNILSETEREIKWTTQPRLNLEITLIKLSDVSANQSIEELLHRIAELEEKVNDLPRQVINNQIDGKHKPKVISSVARNKVTVDFANNDHQTLGVIKEKWSEVLESIKKDKKIIHAFLIEGEPIHFANNLLTIAFKEGYAFHMDKISHPDNRVAIDKITSKIMGSNVAIQCMIQEAATEKNKRSHGDSLVKGAMDLFGEGLIEVKD
jgi:DNA polymerase III subunit gamma/tau